MFEYHEPEAFKWGLHGCDLTKFIDFKVMPSIHNNPSSDVKVCYPASTAPKGFKCCQTMERSITLELAPSSSDHLLGFVSCCIVPPSDFNHFVELIYNNFHFEDEDTNNMATGSLQPSIN